MTKYGNVRSGEYASKREAKRAAELRLLEKAGRIADLREQVPFELIPAQYLDGKCVERSCVYVADFEYMECGIFGTRVVEDVKSSATKTPAYIIKRKLMLRVLNIRVREV